MTEKTKPKYYSIKDIADMLSVSKKYIYDTVTQGELPAVKFSHKIIRIRKADFDSWLQSKEVMNDRL